MDSQHSFTVHIRQHNPNDHSHTCSICSKQLSSASSLDRHMLIHSGERPFKCRICDMAFTTNGNMHRHMRTHGQAQQMALNAQIKAEGGRLRKKARRNTLKSPSMSSVPSVGSSINSIPSNPSTVTNPSSVVSSSSMPILPKLNFPALDSLLLNLTDPTALTNAINSIGALNNAKLMQDENKLLLNNQNNNPLHAGAAAPTTSLLDILDAAGGVQQLAAAMAAQTSKQSNSHIINPTSNSSIGNTIATASAIQAPMIANTTAPSAVSQTSHLIPHSQPASFLSALPTITNPGSHPLLNNSSNSNNGNLSAAQSATAAAAAAAAATGNPATAAALLGFYDLNLGEFGAEKLSQLTRTMYDEATRTLVNQNQTTKNETSRFECEKCDRWFVSQNALNQHMASHKLQTQCRLCDVEFNNAEMYLNHCQIKHVNLILSGLLDVSEHVQVLHGSNKNSSFLPNALSSSANNPDVINQMINKLLPFSDNLNNQAHQSASSLSNALLSDQNLSKLNKECLLSLLQFQQQQQQLQSQSQQPQSHQQQQSHASQIQLNTKLNNEIHCSQDQSNDQKSNSYKCNDSEKSMDFKSEEDAEQEDYKTEPMDSEMDEEMPSDEVNEEDNECNRTNNVNTCLSPKRNSHSNAVLDKHSSLPNANTKHKHSDLTDIQSIISVISNATPLMGSPREDRRALAQLRQLAQPANSTIQSPIIRSPTVNQSSPNTCSSSTPSLTTSANSLSYLSSCFNSSSNSSSGLLGSKSLCASSPNKMSGHEDHEEEEEDEEEEDDAEGGQHTNNGSSSSPTGNRLNAGSPTSSTYAMHSLQENQSPNATSTPNRKRKCSDLYSNESIDLGAEQDSRDESTNAHNKPDEDGDEEEQEEEEKDEDEDDEEDGALANPSSQSRPPRPSSSDSNNNQQTIKSVPTHENSFAADGELASGISAEEEHRLLELQLQQQQYLCTICKLEVRSVNTLRRHQRLHEQGGHLFSCHFCPYTSLDKSSLIRHLRTHNGERPYQCTICSYAFTTKANCERHVRKRHKLQQNNTERVENSTSKGTGFTTTVRQPSQTGQQSSMVLIPHQYYEPGTAETFCKYCKVDFKFNRLLRQHLRTMCNNNFVKKPFACGLCHEEFTSRKHCARHVVRVHPSVDQSRLNEILLEQFEQSSNEMAANNGNGNGTCGNNSINGNNGSTSNQGNNVANNTNNNGNDACSQTSSSNGLLGRTDAGENSVASNDDHESESLFISDDMMSSSLLSNGFSSPARCNTSGTLNQAVAAAAVAAAGSSLEALCKIAGLSDNERLPIRKRRTICSPEISSNASTGRTHSEEDETELKGMKSADQDEDDQEAEDRFLAEELLNEKEQRSRLCNGRTGTMDCDSSALDLSVKSSGQGSDSAICVDASSPSPTSIQEQASAILSSLKSTNQNKDASEFFYNPLSSLFALQSLKSNALNTSNAAVANCINGNNPDLMCNLFNQQPQQFNNDMQQIAAAAAAAAAAVSPKSLIDLYTLNNLSLDKNLASLLPNNENLANLLLSTSRSVALNSNVNQSDQDCFNCQLCPAKFKSKPNLQRHLKRKHPEQESLISSRLNSDIFTSAPVWPTPSCSSSYLSSN